jgi:HAD superfamily hydrolase (TIGR01493 family)
MSNQFPSNATQPRLLSGIRAVAFDCYGTLLHFALQLSPYREMLKFFDLDVDERARVVRLIMTSHLGFMRVPRLLGRALTVEQESSLILKLRLEILSTQMFSEVPRVLAELRKLGLKLALVSNSALEYRDMATDYMGGLFDTELWSFDVGAMKPDPIIYSLLCDKLSLPPGEILMVGDRLRDDVLGARQAGLRAQLLDRRAANATPGSIQNLRELLL